MKVADLRKEFPILSRSVFGKPLVYLDNAATSQRPAAVTEALLHNINTLNSNIHRAVHKLASDETAEYESTRKAVADYIGASSEKEIIFTSGTTASVNLAAWSFGEAFVREGDEIIVSQAEHHSDIVPWQLMCLRKGAVLKVLPVDDSGHLRTDLLPELITPRTKLLAVAHISNVLGLVNPIKDICSLCRPLGVKVFVDGAQGIVHQHINVQDAGCDFYAFSGHKMYAASGTGVLWGRKELLDKMPPYMSGGEMIDRVSFEKTTFAPTPGKFEAGTQNLNATPTLKPAIEMLKIMADSDLQANMEAVSAYLQDRLSSIEGLRIYGIQASPGEKIPLFSFTVEGAHHEDIALILDKMGIAVRSGMMCAEPLMDRFGVTGMVRASFAPYNTMEEAEAFANGLEKALKMLRG